MEQNYDASSDYPEPSSTIVTPYPARYQPERPANSDYSNFNATPYWQPGLRPPIHEGYIPRDDLGDDYNEDRDDDYDDDPERNLRALTAKYDLGHILNPHNRTSHSTGYQYGERLDDDMVLDDDEDETVLESDVIAGPQQPADEDVDPDFEGSDDGQTSGDNMSLDSELLDEIVDEPPVRGRGAKRGTTGRGRGRRGWKWALAGTEHDPKLNKPRGRPGRPQGSTQVPRGEGRKRGGGAGTKHADPGAEYKKLQQKATQNFLDGDLDAAADFAREAVQANPEVFAAHSLLSEILSAQGREEDSLTVLYAGAHTKRDKELWHHCAERTLDLAGDDRTLEVLDKAVYAYNWAIKLDQKDLEARRAKLNLLLEIYNVHDVASAPSRAKQECRMILRMRPSEMPVVNTFAELALLNNAKPDLVLAKQAFDEAIDIYSKGKVLGEAAEQWSYLNVYLDLVRSLDGPSEAIKKLKTLSRWLLGRVEESYWDRYEDDDREYDLSNEPRRLQVDDFVNQADPDSAQYGAGLPLDIRTKLGTYRMALGPQHHTEAMRHYEVLLSFASEIIDYADLFRDTGFELKSNGDFANAIRFLEPLQDVPDYQDTTFYMTLGDCYVALDRLVDAEDCYNVIVNDNEDEWEARIALAKLYEKQDRGQEALPLIDRVIQLGRVDALRKGNINVGPQPPSQTLRKSRGHNHDRTATLGSEEALSATGSRDSTGPQATPRSLPLGPSKRKRLGRKGGLLGIPSIDTLRRRNGMDMVEDLRNMDQRIKANWETLLSTRHDVDNGDEEGTRSWVQAAGSMVDDFRSMRIFNPGRDKHVKFTGYGKQTRLLSEMEAMRDRLQADDLSPSPSRSQQPMNSDGIPDDFHDITFQQWLDIFCEYAIHLARDGSREACFDILQTGNNLNVFYHSPPFTQQIHATWLSCALILNDEQQLNAVCRWYMSTFPHSHGPYQLFLAVSRLHAGSNPNWFNSGPTQKFLLRAIKAMDYHLLNPTEREHYTYTAQEISSYTNGGKREPNWMKFPGHDPGLLALYGHVMSVAGSWNSALNYYFRALALVPRDVTLNLCIGLAYVQNALKRQSENRHYGILQGLGFLNRYYELRTTGRLTGDDGADGAVREEKGGGEVQVPAVHKQEAEYNLARAWHLLGLTHHAVRGYEKCLALSGQVREEQKRRRGGTKSGRDAKEDGVAALGANDADSIGNAETDGDAPRGADITDGHEDDSPVVVDAEEFTQEAALALVQIYSMADNEAAARRIAEKYLVI